jgi:hypothetical protein
MFTRRQHKPPKVHLEHLEDLIVEAQTAVTATGVATFSAVRWLTPGRLLVQMTFGSWQEYTPPAMVIIGERLATVGLTCRWEGEELVIEWPGWTPPPPRIVEIQPSLFD